MARRCLSSLPLCALFTFTNFDPPQTLPSSSRCHASANSCGVLIRESFSILQPTVHHLSFSASFHFHQAYPCLGKGKTSFSAPNILRPRRPIFLYTKILVCLIFGWPTNTFPIIFWAKMPVHSGPNFSIRIFFLQQGPNIGPRVNNLPHKAQRTIRTFPSPN